MATIAHVDMDAFFAAVEVRANPHLAGKPLVVGGGPGDRGVVTTASYPARRYGIRSGMSAREARARCPDLIVLPVDPARYVHESEKLLRVFERFTPAVEPASIDEAFLDLTGLGLAAEGAIDLARRIKKTVLEEHGLTCSIGLGRNKLEAKMATGLMKPDGLVQLLEGDFESLFAPRSVLDLWGVGPETARVLAGIGITTIGQLARSDDTVLSRLFGVAGKVLIRMARGSGGGPVVPYYEGLPVRSMGHEMTFARDVSDPAVLEAHLLLLADKVARRLRREDYAGHVVSIRIKWADRTAISRQKALACPTDQEGEILAQARRLLRLEMAGCPAKGKAPGLLQPVRLLGLSVGHLISGRNLYPLFEADRKAREVSRLKDRLRDRFGESIVMPAGVLSLIRKSRK